jgi:hypothetical protein
MAVLVTSSPVEVPTGIRITAGKIDFNGTTYAAGGLAVTAAQFGAGSGGIPNRAPDFVLFTSGTSAVTPGTATTAGTQLKYIAATSKVAVYGTEPLVDEEGLGEDDAASNFTVANFIAVWVTVTPGGPVTA